MIITIDGPAGSGKSTTARLVAKRLGYKYIDSGATYRAVALAIKRNRINPSNEEVVQKLSSEVQIDFEDGKVLLDGEDITQAIRDEEIGKIASLCSSYRGVRKNMVALQRALAGMQSEKSEVGCIKISSLRSGNSPRKERNVVCEGRDIGTVVFPDAQVKIYMEASLTERAKRRKLELENMGIYRSINEIESDLKLRDVQDMEREHSPLRVPGGAITVDTTNLSIEEEVEEVIKIIKSSQATKQSRSIG